MGISMAFMAAMKGYKMVLTMPSYTSLERRVTMRAFGADLIVTDPTKGMGGTIKKAYDLLESTPNGFMLQQFSNPANTQVPNPISRLIEELKNYLLAPSRHKNFFCCSIILSFVLFIIILLNGL
jgi:hypothetical protein